MPRTKIIFHDLPADPDDSLDPPLTGREFRQLMRNATKLAEKPNIWRRLWRRITRTGQGPGE